MKIGLGLRNDKLCSSNLKFARQIGATHIISLLPGEEVLPSTKDGYWTYEDLWALRKYVEDHGLKLEAIENFAPIHWDHILLDGPEKHIQMENLKKTISNMGKAGIPIMGYNFTIAGVRGLINGPFARGGAKTPAYIKEKAPEETSIPYGFAWGRQLRHDVPEGNIGVVTEEEMWSRITYFLENIIPVAEEAGVKLAAHPEDPPLPVLRNTARLLTKPEKYNRLFDIFPSDHNLIEFCQGTFSEMPDVDVYDEIRSFAAQNKIGYVHFRNVKGKLPNYYEVFIDEGDVDMVKALSTYKECGYQGVIIPDHTPEPDCPGPWHAGIAYAVGYIRAIMNMLGIELD